jgi:hypothetical protein
LKAQLSEQETKWRKAYEKVVKENELLRTRGGETVLAVQWRERYEVRALKIRVCIENCVLHCLIVLSSFLRSYYSLDRISIFLKSVASHQPILHIPIYCYVP